MDSAMLQHNRYCHPDQAQCNRTSGARLSSIGVREMPYQSLPYDCGPLGMSSYSDCGVRPGKTISSCPKLSTIRMLHPILFFGKMDSPITLIFTGYHLSTHLGMPEFSHRDRIITVHDFHHVVNNSV